MVSISLPTDAGGLYFAGIQGLYLPAGDRVGSTDYAIAHVRPRNLALLTSTPTLSVAGAYATGDYIGPSTSPTSFSAAVIEAGAKARLVSLAIVDKATAAAVALELWLFSATFTAPNDNAAWAITDAHAAMCQGVIEIPTTRWYASSNNKVFSRDDLNLIVQPSGTALFYALVSRGSTPTWASGDLALTLGVEQA